MSGNIKVSGTWKTTGNVYVKVGGTWRTAFQAYTKVGGTWKLWYSNVSDTFTRANTSSGLGTAEIGPSWNSLFGNWYVNSGAATSGDAVSAGVAGAISYLNLNNANATVSVGGQTTTAGVGPAVWVSAAGSWWAAIGYNGQVNGTYTYSCNCSCNGHTVASCRTCANAAFGTSTGTSYYNPSSYAATATATYDWVATSGSPVVSSYGETYNYTSSYTVYSCPNGGTSGAGGNSDGSCYSTSYTYSCGAGTYLGNGSSYAPSTTSCYYNRNDQYAGPATATPHYTYVGPATVSYACAQGSPCSFARASCCNSTPNYSSTCSDGSTYRLGGCYNYVQTNTTYSCPSGGSLFQGATCVSCPSGGTFQYYAPAGGYVCVYSYTYNNTGTSCTYCGTDYPFYSGGTYPNCDSYGSTCQTCTGGTITNQYYMQIINSTTTGSSYTVYSTSSDYGTQIGSISITTSGNNLTATAYSTTGSSLGTLTATNSGTKGGGAGLVKAYTPYNQAVTGDNFSATLGATS